MTTSSPIHVAVGVLYNAVGEVLISRRHPNSHQGGLWEFPGGKVEWGEDVQRALKREFEEELGVTPLHFSPLKKILYHYSDKSVLLDVWTISEFIGEPTGLEGQAVEWRSIPTLPQRDFPVANGPIIKCLSLPHEIAITPDVSSFDHLQSLLQLLIGRGLKLIQIRQTQLDSAEYLDWFRRARDACEGTGVDLILNQAPALLDGCSAAGFHASASCLQQLTQRPIVEDALFSASCHNLEELRKAEALGTDFVSLSPICRTEKYAESELLGWDEFQALADKVSLPVYALGGIQRSDRDKARFYGGHGITGIRTFL